MELSPRHRNLAKRQRADPSIATSLADALASTSSTTRRRRRPSRTLSSTTAPTTRRRTPATTATSDVLLSEPSSSSSLSPPGVSSSSALLSLPSSSSVASSSSASVSAAAQSSSNGQLPAPVKTAVIATSVSVGGAILLALLIFCLCKRRKASGSQGPSPLIGSLEDDDRKSFADYSQQSDYPAAVNAWDGRPLSFLNNVHSTLQSQNLHPSNGQSMSQLSGHGPALARSTVDDPFRFGFGKGSHSLTAALANDLATARGPALQSQAREVLREDEEPERVQHPYSEASFSRQKSVRFNNNHQQPAPHPFVPAGTARVTNPDADADADPRYSQFVDSYSDTSAGRQSQQYR